MAVKAGTPGDLAATVAAGDADHVDVQDVGGDGGGSGE